MKKLFVLFFAVAMLMLISASTKSATDLNVNVKDGVNVAQVLNLGLLDAMQVVNIETMTLGKNSDAAMLVANLTATSNTNSNLLVRLINEGDAATAAENLTAASNATPSAINWIYELCAIQVATIVNPNTDEFENWPGFLNKT